LRAEPAARLRVDRPHGAARRCDPERDQRGTVDRAGRHRIREQVLIRVSRMERRERRVRRAKYFSALIAISAFFIFSLNSEILAVATIHAYQRTLSPLAARAGIRCRFNPTCSRYAETVIRRDGVVRGSWESLKRVARCGPWTPDGTSDLPVR